MGTAAKPTRENRTITVDFHDEVTYVQLLGDGKAFVECVLAFLLALGFQLAHKATCRGGGCLTRHSHDVRARLRHARSFTLHRGAGRQRAARVQTFSGSGNDRFISNAAIGCARREGS